MPLPGSARPLIATYRLQLGPSFTFDDAARAVPYVASLGASHLYLSPAWECVAGSTHGYDVIDHAAVRHEIGGLAGLLRLREAADREGLGLVFDIVPNHVGIAGARHPWWRDVLRFGQASPYAPFFDIDWHGRPPLAAGIVVAPVLGRPFGEALEDGELRLEFDGAELVVRYFDHSYPLAPASYPDVVGLFPFALSAGLRDPGAYAAMADAVERLGAAPPEEARHALADFARLLRAEAALRERVEERLAAFSGTPGDPASWDALDALLGRQHYRLAYWRVSGEEINYRRFFDINDLAAIRQENPEVFEATHSLVARLVDEGIADGLRVDHVDGLYDPARYLEDLASLAGGAPVWVEKILADGEALPEHWRVAGTTGYEFLAVAGGLFVDASSEPAFDALYHEFCGVRATYAEIASEARVAVAEASFSGELSVLAAELHRLAQRDRRFRDVTVGAFRDAIETLLAAFPVYRTYLENGEPRAVDRGIIEGAAARATRLDPRIPPQAMAFLARALLLDGDRVSEDETARRVHFRRRFQQISSPVMARGVEDTTFFRFNRLLALNEVGAHPGHFGTSPAAFHAWAEERARRWPDSLSASSTHDTKRSEDARARLAVLSEMPAAWRREIRAWSRLNKRDRDGGFPDANTEYYLYQSLAASWERPPAPDYTDRIAAHMRKAVREAKQNTSWANPDEAYESAIEAFVRTILDPRRSPRFLARLERWVARIEPAAAVNSLGLLALKCLAPGVPDIYQGSERPFFALTDPDNRRPVAFPSVAAAAPGALPPGGFPEAKPWLLRRLLALRARHYGAFQGSYRALEATGEAANRVLAFERAGSGASVVAIVPRLVSSHVDTTGRLTLPPAAVALPPGRRWRDVLAGEDLGALTSVGVGALLARFPVAVLVGDAV